MRISVVEGNLVVASLPPPPQAMWPGGADSSRVLFTWWPAVGPPADYYYIYRDGTLFYPSALGMTGVTATTGWAGNGNGQFIFVDIVGTPNTSHTYQVASVISGNVGTLSSPLTLTTLGGPGTTLPTPVVDPSNWIVAEQLPTSAAVICTTTAQLQNALANSNINGNNLIVIPKGTVLQAPLAGWNFRAWNGTAGWTYIIDDQATVYNASGTLIPYSYVAQNVEWTTLTATAAIAANATSLTLTAAYTGRSGVYPTYFQSSTAGGLNENRLCTYTNGSTAVTWNANVPLAGAATTNVQAHFGNYVTPGDVGSMATLQQTGTGTSGTIFNVPAGCTNVRLIGLNLTPTSTGVCGSSIAFTPTQVNGAIQAPAQNFYVDRCIVGNDSANLGAGFAYMNHGIANVNCVNFLVHQTFGYGFANNGANNGGVSPDTQFIFLQGSGPFCVQNSFIEAVSEGVLSGGAYVAQTQQPTGFTYRYNYNQKATQWLTSAIGNVNQGGPKNHYELKSMVGSACYGNLHVSCWQTFNSGGQNGCSFVIDVADQGCITTGNPLTNWTPWLRVTDIDIHDNKLVDVGQLVKFAEASGDASNVTARCRFSNNIGIGNPIGGGMYPALIWVQPWCPDITIDNNTLTMNSTAPGWQGGSTSTTFYGITPGSPLTSPNGTPNGLPVAKDRWTITDNITDGAQLFHGDNSATGLAAVNNHLTNYTFTNNLTTTDTNATYPGTEYLGVPYASIGTQVTITNTYPPSPGFIWNVQPPSIYATASTIGGPLGAHFGLSISTLSLPAAQQNVAYSFQMQASSGSPVSWSATGLPAGLTMSSSGVISGIPTTVGTSNVHLTVTNVQFTTSAVEPLTVNPNSGLVNWAPGHYLQFGNNDTSASRLAFISTLPAGVGVYDNWFWGGMETVQGTYNFSNSSGANPLGVLAACHAAGRPYMFNCLTREFGGSSITTSTVPQYIINNNWYYTRTSPNAAAGAALWVPGCMTAKANLEIAFYNAAVAAGTASSIVAVGGDETIFGGGITLAPGCPAFNDNTYVANELSRWQTFRAACPPVGIFVECNFMDADTTTAPFPTMRQMFANGAATPGVFLNAAPDALFQNYTTSSATPAQQVLDGRDGGNNYIGGAYGVMCSSQDPNAPSTVTPANIFSEHDGHFHANYIIWNRTPWTSSVTIAQVLSFIASNPVTHTAYPSTWPGAPQLSFSQVFNFTSFPSLPASIQLNTNSGGVSGGALNLCSGAHSVGSAWYTTQVNISQFRTDFTFQFPPGQINPACKAMAFVIQNSNTTTNPNGSNGGSGQAFGTFAAGDANLAGFGAYWWINNPTLQFQYGIGNSVAIKFDMSSGNGSTNGAPSGGHITQSGPTVAFNPQTGFPNSVGLYTNVGPSAGLMPACDINGSGVNFYNGNVMAGTIVYDGTILTLVLKDTVTNAQLRISWPVSITTVCGGSNAWVGFTAGQAPSGTSNASGGNFINTWSFNSGVTSGSLSRLNTPIFSVPPGQYTSAQTVSITAPAGAMIFYSTNGVSPSSSGAQSIQYTGPITVSASTVLQAVAVQSGFTDSQVASAYYQIVAGGTPSINFPSGFTGTKLLSLVGNAAISGSNLILVPNISGLPDPPHGFVGCAWFPLPVNVGTFNTTFVFQLQVGGNYTEAGLTFCIQNQPLASDFSFNNAAVLAPQFGGANTLRWSSGGPLAFANGGGAATEGFGYSGGTGSAYSQITGLSRSVAVKFDSNATNGTGLYTNTVGAAGTDVSLNTVTATGLSFTSAHQFKVQMDYNNATSPGNNLRVQITDLTSLAVFTNSYAVNVASVVGGSTAYVGFTAGSYYCQLQQIVNWTWTS